MDGVDKKVLEKSTDHHGCHLQIYALVRINCFHMVKRNKEVVSCVTSQKEVVR